MEGWLQTASIIAGSIVTISGALGIITKFIKKALVKATKESINEQMSENQAKIDAQISTLDTKIEDISTKLDNFINNQEAVNDDIKKSLMNLTRDRINEAHNYYMKKGFIGDHSLWTLEELYKSYHKLGGNSFITDQMNDIRGLEHRSAELASINKKD